MIVVNEAENLPKKHVHLASASPIEGLGVVEMERSGLKATFTRPEEQGTR